MNLRIRELVKRRGQLDQHYLIQVDVDDRYYSFNVDREEVLDLIETLLDGIGMDAGKILERD